MKTRILFSLICMASLLLVNTDLNAQNKKTTKTKASKESLKKPDAKGTIYKDSLPWVKDPNQLKNNQLQKTSNINGNNIKANKRPNRKGTIYTDSLPWVKDPNQLRNPKAKSTNNVNGNNISGTNKKPSNVANQGKNHLRRNNPNGQQRKRINENQELRKRPSSKVTNQGKNHVKGNNPNLNRRKKKKNN